MQKVLILPVLAAVLFTAGCGGDGDPTAPGTTAGVRFFNATTGMTGDGGFTTNGRFATGSALAFGQSTQTCSRVDAGATSIGFGAANSGRTDLSGNALATLDNQTIAEGGNYTVAATGSAASPTLYLLDNRFPGSVAANQAAVRFVNLAPGTDGTVNTFTAFIGTPANNGTMVATNIAVGAPTIFHAVTGGATEFTVFVNGHNLVISGSAATLDLQAGTVNTIAIVPNATLDGFQLVNLPRCS